MGQRAAAAALLAIAAVLGTVVRAQSTQDPSTRMQAMPNIAQLEQQATQLADLAAMVQASERAQTP